MDSSGIQSTARHVKPCRNARREVVLADASLGLYLLYVLLVHATASENNDAVGGELMQLGEQRCTFERRGLLARCQCAVDAELNELFECAARIIAAVKGAVDVAS